MSKIFIGLGLIWLIGALCPPLWTQAGDDFVWVANSNSNNVTRIKKSDSTTTTIDVGTTPYGVAIDETYCWVANSGGGNVTRIKKSDSTMTTIAVGIEPYGVAVDETYCWVANLTRGNVTRIKKSDSTQTTIAVGVGAGPWGVAVDETDCWVANWGGNNCTRIKKSDSTQTTIAVGTRPYSLGDMTGYAYDFFWCTRVIKPEALLLKLDDNLTNLIAVSLNDLRDSTKCQKTEAVLVGLKEKAIEPLVNAFNDDLKKEEETYQTLLKEINQLIPQLGAEEWREREQAQKRLEAIGTKAIPLLKEAKEKDKDPEIRMRAKMALEQIEEQGGSESELNRRGFISSLLDIMGNIGPLNQPALECFVKTLSDNDRRLRGLAYKWLKKLTKKDLPFDPAKSPPEEATHIQAWQTLIEKE